MGDFDIQTKGLTEFVDSVNRLASALPETARVVSAGAAGIVVTTAKPKVPRRSGRAADSVQAYVSGNISVAGGGAGVAYYRWLELGGAAGRNHSVMRARSDGRYINPSYEERKADIQRLLEESLTTACRNAGLEVT